MKDLLKEIEKDPFHSDCLERKDFVTNISNVLVNSSGDTVYSLEASFGAGKTVLNHRIKSYIDKNHKRTHNVILLDAREGDFYENPFIPIIEGISKSFSTFTSKDVKNALEIINKEALSFCFKKGWEALKLAEPRLEQAEKGFKLLKKLQNKQEEKRKEEQEVFSEYSKLKDAKNNFIEGLKQLSKKKKIIIIIDELDRCKPDYAIIMLETIKHFFGVEGITFVFSINKEQLNNSVKCIYGIEKEGFDNYIRKFIDFSFTMPEPSNEQFATYLYEKSNIKTLIDGKLLRYRVFSGKENLSSRYSIYLYNFDKAFINNFTAFSEHYKIPLRTQEQIFNKLEVLISSFEKSDFIIPELIIGMLFIEDLEYHTFKNMVNNFGENNFPLPSTLLKGNFYTPKYAHPLQYDPFKELFNFYQKLIGNDTRDCSRNFYTVNDNKPLFPDVFGDRPALLRDLKESITNSINKIQFIHEISKSSENADLYKYD